MKNFLILIILILLQISKINAQQNEYGIYTSLNQYIPTNSVFKQKNNYYDAMAMINTNFSVFINFHIKDSLTYLCSGIKGQTFYKYQEDINVGDVLIKEVFYQIPIQLNKRIYLSNKCSLGAGVGIYANILGNQNYIFKDNVIIPDDFIIKNGFASYIKFGINTNLSYNYYINTKTGINFGFNTNVDIPNLSISSKKDINMFSYVSAGIHLGFFFKL